MQAQVKDLRSRQGGGPLQGQGEARKDSFRAGACASAAVGRELFTNGRP